jgi:3-hydroxyisobutyrate dehydrogenase
MGSAMARRLAGAGLEVRVWNRTADRAQALSDVATPCVSSSEAVTGASFVLTMLADADAVQRAVLDDTSVLGGAAPDAIWIQSSTVGADASERFMALARDRGVGFVDAPVVGTRQPAERGELTVLASGRAEDIARCRPLLAAIGNRTIELGTGTEASQMKLATNAWVLGLTATLAECIALTEQLGLDPAALLNVITGTAVDSPFVSLKGHAMIEGNYPPAFPLRHAAKDADLIAAASDDSAGRLTVADAVRRHFVRAAELGYGDDDIAAVVQSITDRDRNTPVDVRLEQARSSYGT